MLYVSQEKKAELSCSCLLTKPNRNLSSCTAWFLWSWKVPRFALPERSGQQPYKTQSIWGGITHRPVRSALKVWAGDVMHYSSRLKLFRFGQGVQVWKGLLKLSIWVVCVIRVLWPKAPLSIAQSCTQIHGMTSARTVISESDKAVELTGSRVINQN